MTTTKQRVLKWQRRFQAADERAGVEPGTTAVYVLGLVEVLRERAPRLANMLANSQRATDFVTAAMFSQDQVRIDAVPQDMDQLEQVPKGPPPKGGPDDGARFILEQSGIDPDRPRGPND